MRFLLDTNVVSEWTKPSPHAGVIRWLAEVDEDEVFLSVVTIAEIQHGIERLPKGARRKRLEWWLGEELLPRFEGRLLAVDVAVAKAWGSLVASSRAAGGASSIMDAFLAATAKVHGLTFVTRNVADFAALDQSVFNPWRAE